jgi:phage terminase large subunit-like protein
VNKTQERILTKDLVTMVLVDPARTVMLQAAESAVVTVSVSRSSRKIFIRDIFAERVRPDELYEAIFAAVLFHNAMLLAVEVTGLHEFISQPLQNEMRVRGIYPQYIELNAKGDKDMRISTLAPNYRHGYVYHNKTNCRPLEMQLELHPRSKRKDIMDALSYVSKVMDEHAIFFDPSEDEMLPDEFDELDDEKMMSDDWQII